MDVVNNPSNVENDNRESFLHCESSIRLFDRQTRSRESEWRDEMDDSNPGRMYPSESSEKGFISRREDQTFTEYCDAIGRNALIGSFVIFCFAYVVYMIVVHATSE